MRDARGRRRSTPARSGVWTLILGVTWVVTASCVGSDSADAGSQTGRAGSGAPSAKMGEAAGAGAEARAATRVEYSDNVAPLEYQIFERVVQGESPPKTLHRLLVLVPESQERLIKTVRVALDSIAAADTTVVAARAILYVFNQTGPREGDVIPVVWGEWLPPEGWAEAGPDSRRRLHRTYVYFGVPAWSEAEAGAASAPRQP